MRVLVLRFRRDETCAGTTESASSRPLKSEPTDQGILMVKGLGSSRASREDEEAGCFREWIFRLPAGIETPGEAVAKVSAS